MRIFSRATRLCGLVCLIITALVLSGLSGAATSAQPSEYRATLSDGLAETAARLGSVRVLVVLNMNAQTQGSLAFPQLSEPTQIQAITTAQREILALPALRTAQEVRQYRYFPFLALTVDRAGLDALATSRLVEYVIEDGMRAPALAESTVQIGLQTPDGPWARGATGEGWTVAIVDTGVAKSHSFLTGKVISEACYGTNTTGVDRNNNPYKVISMCPGTVTGTTATDSGLPCSLAQYCDHGTHVAGIATGNGPQFKGVAYEANVIAIQAFSRIEGVLCGNTAGVCALARDADILAGIERVYALKDTHKIAAVNLSLGGGTYYTPEQCDADLLNVPYKIAADKLATANIVIVAAAGNGIGGSGLASAMEAPACVSNIISVSSVGTDANQDAVSTFANRAFFLDLMAPGYKINASVPGGGFAEKNGTSQATAHVTGTLALLRQYTEGKPVDNALILKTLKDMGKPITDGFATYPRIRVNRAVNFLTFPDIPLLDGPDEELILHKPGITFTWQPGDDTDEYRLRVRDESGKAVFKKTVKHSECTDVCTVTTDAVMTDKHTHTWDVRAFNAFQKAKSDVRTFKVDYPGAPTLNTPVDGLVINDPAELTSLNFSIVETADTYEVLLRDITKPNKPVRIFRQKFAPDAAELVCTATDCTVNIPQSVRDALKDDAVYGWRVIASNNLGKSRSPQQKFRADIPGAPDLISPANGYIANAPDDLEQLVWEQIVAATSYQVIVRDITNAKKPVEIFRKAYTLGAVGLICDEGECVYTVPEELFSKLKNKRAYDWQIHARNEAGKSKSVRNRFTTDFPPPGTPGLSFPTANVVFNDPSELTMLQWTNLSDVTKYLLVIEDVTKPTRRYPILDAEYTTDDPELTCVGAFCTYTIADSTRAKLIDGHRYRWYVAAQNLFGSSSSEKRPFTASFPGQSTLLLPTDKLVMSSRNELTTFQWTAIPLATSYKVVMIDKASGKRIVKKKLAVGDAELVCDATNCSYTIPDNIRASLKNRRTYRWFVQSINMYGKDKSKPFTFKTRF